MKYVLLVMFSFLLMAMTCRKVDRSTTNVKENSDSLSLAIKIRQYDSLYKETELLKKTILELKSQGAKFEQPKVDTAAIKKMFEGFGCPPSKVDSILKVLTTANAKIKILKNGQGHPISLVDLAIHWSSLNSDGEVDRAVSTEGLYVAMTGTGSEVKLPQADREPLAIAKKMIDESSFHYRSFSDFVINVKDKRGRYVEYFSFSLHREGLTWRLSNGLLPVV